ARRPVDLTRIFRRAWDLIRPSLRNSRNTARRMTSSRRSRAACAKRSWPEGPSAMSGQPFANGRVPDFTHYLAGPYPTLQLAMQGADVIKVEPRAGDGMRIGPVSKEWSEREDGTNLPSCAMETSHARWGTNQMVSHPLPSMGGHSLVRSNAPSIR